MGEFIGDSFQCRGVVRRVLLDAHEAAVCPDAGNPRASASHERIADRLTFRGQSMDEPAHQRQRLLARVQRVVAVVGFLFPWPRQRAATHYRFTIRAEWCRVRLPVFQDMRRFHPQAHFPDALYRAECRHDFRRTFQPRHIEDVPLRFFAPALELAFLLPATANPSGAVGLIGDDGIHGERQQVLPASMIQRHAAARRGITRRRMQRRGSRFLNHRFGVGVHGLNRSAEKSDDTLTTTVR